MRMNGSLSKILLTARCENEYPVYKCAEGRSCFLKPGWKNENLDKTAIKKTAIAPKYGGVNYGK